MNLFEDNSLVFVREIYKGTVKIQYLYTYEKICFHFLQSRRQGCKIVQTWNYMIHIGTKSWMFLGRLKDQLLRACW